MKTPPRVAPADRWHGTMPLASRGRSIRLCLASLVVLVVVLGGPVPASRTGIGPDQVLTVSVQLDRSAYLSGDTATATAMVYRTPSPANYTYTWRVLDFASRVVNTTSDGPSLFDYEIPLNYTGRISFEVTVNDDDGLVASAIASTTVAVAVMALRLNQGDFVPGDTITVTYSVLSHVILRPTYDYVVFDANSTIVKSETTNATSFSFRTPVPASPSYTFLVTAREGTNRTEARVTIAQASGVLLAVTFDKGAYSPGESIRAHLTVTARGTTALPRQFEWFLGIGGLFPTAASATAITTEPQADLVLTIPSEVGSGDLVVFALERRTGAIQYVTVRVGTTNPLWTTEVAGIPLFAILLGLLSILTFVAIIALWRRVASESLGLEAPQMPTPPPVAAPSAPSPREPPAPRIPAVPHMSLPCTHCGKTIELSTSKRPIEVMCPSCGETQLVT